MEGDKSKLVMQVQFEEKISRMFIFRFFNVFILIFVMIPVVILGALASQLHFWYMLILGKRAKFLFDLTAKIFVWMTDWKSYLSNFTDKKPGFWF